MLLSSVVRSVALPNATRTAAKGNKAATSGTKEARDHGRSRFRRPRRRASFPSRRCSGRGGQGNGEDGSAGRAQTMGPPRSQSAAAFLAFAQKFNGPCPWTNSSRLLSTVDVMWPNTISTRSTDLVKGWLSHIRSCLFICNLSIIRLSTLSKQKATFWNVTSTNFPNSGVTD